MKLNITAQRFHGVVLDQVYSSFGQFFSQFVIPIFHSLLYSYFYWLSVNMKAMASAINREKRAKLSQA